LVADVGMSVVSPFGICPVVISKIAGGTAQPAVVIDDRPATLSERYRLALSKLVVCMRMGVVMGSKQLVGIGALKAKHVCRPAFYHSSDILVIIIIFLLLILLKHCAT